MRNPIIAALDVPTTEVALDLVQKIAPLVGGFKIGSELFTSAGPDIVRRVRRTGAAVFLDLKFHDIPHTVASSSKLFKSKALDTGDNFSFTFTTPGTYEYFCSLHPHMAGAIVVEAATGSTRHDDARPTAART